MTITYEAMSDTELRDALCALQDCPEATNIREHVARVLQELQVHQIRLEAEQRQRRSVDAQIEEARARYRDLFEHAPAGYCTFDASGCIRELNLAAAELLGADPKQVRTQPFTALLPAEERQRFRDHVRECFRERRTVTTELSLRPRQRAPVTLQLASSPITRADGGVAECRTLLNDVSSHVRTESALRYLSDASDALGASLDYNSTLATVVRLAVPSLADIACLDLIDDDGSLHCLEVAFADGRKQALTDQLKQHAPGSEYARLKGKTLEAGVPISIVGAERAAAAGPRLAAPDAPVSMLLVPLLARQHSLGLLTLIMSDSHRSHGARELGLAKDLAARAAMAIDNAQLYRTAQIATQLRDEVLAVVAHDLKSPLSSITLSTSDLLRSAPAEDRRSGRRQLEAIKRGAERMDGLIGDLLDLSSLEAAHLPIRRSEHDINDLLSAAYDLLQPLVRAKGLQFLLQRIEPPASVVCDRARVLQVFSNLVGNAIEFTPRGGTIALGAEMLDGKACLTVSDTGPGVAPRLRQRVFERYWQADPSANKGRGLGLYISKGIVEAHGGAIWVDGSPQGGSVFRFSLPLRLPMAKRALSSAAPAAPDARPCRALLSVKAAPRAEKLVLVVDDDEHMRGALSHVLAAEGYRVAEACNGLQAVQYLNGCKAVPSLILIDLQMPVMDGVQLLSELKSSPSLASVPVVVISSHNLKEKIATFEVAAFLEKPVQVDRLLKTITLEREHNSPGRMM